MNYKVQNSNIDLILCFVFEKGYVCNCITENIVNNNYKLKLPVNHLQDSHVTVPLFVLINIISTVILHF